MENIPVNNILLLFLKKFLFPSSEGTQKPVLKHEPENIAPAAMEDALNTPFFLPVTEPRSSEVKRVSRGLHRYVYCAVRGRETAKASILFQHGFRGHGEPYIPYAEYLSVEKNANVVLIDLPAHGKSPGGKCRIGHIKHMEACVNHGAVVTCAKNKSPLILMGFSVGGLVELHYLLLSAPRHIRNRVAGIIGIGVPLDVSNNVKRWRLWLAPIIAHLFPQREIPELRMNIEELSHDPEKREKVMADPLVYKGPLNMWTAYIIHQMTKAVRYQLWAHFHKKASTTFLQRLKNFFYRRKNAYPVDIPMLFLRGADDPIAELAPYETYEIPVVSFPGFRHEILTGEGTEVVIKYIDAWIEQTAIPRWKRKLAVRNHAHH